MINKLHLQQPLLLIVLGIAIYVSDKLFNENNLSLSSFALALAGALLVLGSALFLYPVVFAKKADPEGKKVELMPLPEDEKK